MPSQSYLLFSLQNLLFSIDVLQVREIIYLPELTPVVNAPNNVVGAINLREKILPIVDLDLCFNRSPHEYQLSDRIIVIGNQEQLIGIVVNQVHDVVIIDDDWVETPTYHYTTQVHESLIAGVAKLDNSIITLLNAGILLRQCYSVTENVHQNGDGLQPELPQSNGVSWQFCPNASPEERAVLRDRALNLAQPSGRQDLTGLMALAVVEINHEFFGINLAAVCEFANLSKITPIPCCPSHIVGNMNLRGEILTLIDLHNILNIAPSNTQEVSKVIVIKVDDIIAGILVDQVLDVTYVHASDVHPLATAVHAENRDYLQGSILHQEQMMTLFDVSKLLSQGDLVVNDQR